MKAFGMMMRWSTLTSALLVVGCTQEVESTDVRTSGVFPEIQVTATGSGSSRVEVRLKVGGRASNTFLDLQGPDTLEASAAGLTKTLDSSSLHGYGATFPTEAAGTFVITFRRGSADVSAPSSTVTLPAPFGVTLSGTEFSRATQDVGVTWTPPGSGNMALGLNGSCIRHLSEDTPDDGSATISRDRITPEEGQSQQNCTVNLSLTRSQSGEVDPAFTEGGTIVARQSRTASFTTMP
jgi:hypothetical protein